MLDLILLPEVCGRSVTLRPECDRLSRAIYPSGIEQNCGSMKEATDGVSAVMGNAQRLQERKYRTTGPTRTVFYGPRRPYVMQ